MLSDALPDDFGNALINAWMQSRSHPLESITTLDRLAYMGKRGMGALEFKPALGSQARTPQVLKLQSLVEEARKAVQGNLSEEAPASAGLNQIISVGTSAGGARAKAVIAWNPQTGEMRSGQFKAEPGFEHWLLKFDGMGEDRGLGKGQNYGKTEFAQALMAEAAGIQMTPCRLLHENGRAHFMTKRFDREGDEKHHVQPLCAMAHLDFKQIQGQPWTLAPAYDVTFAHNPTGKWTHQHQMSVNGKFTDITRADLLLDAERFGVRRPEKLLGDVAAAIGSFDEFAAQAELPTTRRDEIRADFRVL